MELAEVMQRLGGVAKRADLVALTSRAEFDSALRNGEIVRDAHGRYSLPVAHHAHRTANALGGVVSHRTAALLWGWELKVTPPLPDVTVRRNRVIAPERRTGVALHRANLPPDAICDGVTSREQTLLHCLTSLPFDEALAVADSARRHGDVGQRQLIELTARLKGTGAPQARRVAHEASPLAANPFESVLRAIGLDVPGIDLRPQVVIADETGQGRPDLVDVDRRWVVEAESHTWHSKRGALRRDCRRYTQFVLLGWRVLRFAWEDVMFHPDYVHGCLTRAARLCSRDQVA